MRWDIGSVYKEIRKSKNLSQKDICGKTLSRTTISKFENNKLVPSYPTMEFLLRQISMTFEEFEFLCNKNGENKRMDILLKYKAVLSSAETKRIVPLIEQCDEYLKNEDDIAIKESRQVLISLMEIAKGKFEVTDDFRDSISELWDKLKAMDTWYYTDLMFINILIFKLPIETLKEIDKPILESIKKYEKYNKGAIHFLKMCIFINLSTIYMQNNFVEQAIHFAELAAEVAKQIKNYYFLSYAYIRLGICKNEQKLIIDGLTLLEIAGEDDFLKEMKDEINYYKEKTNS
ncbi:hypothetical protein BG262_05015 [Floricoccus penangensis]|uniref:HTH cro/C1-type domain-containing protein n=1 Tax=Floricoccus penangensis TaxID=1859475 RepID=A0A9Q5JFZ9_9LACT|nr:helix-turn-helix transcriptional regulator [Floricoccus penangensis]OFI46379.1 hypothetical protein BG262_05015 [Floricoccus penangensis]